MSAETDPNRGYIEDIPRASANSPVGSALELIIEHIDQLGAVVEKLNERLRHVSNNHPVPTVDEIRVALDPMNADMSKGDSPLLGQLLSIDVNIKLWKDRIGTIIDKLDI